MNQREIRKAMRERKKELRGAMARLRSATKARLESNPAVRRERARRRVRRLAGVAVLVLLASLLNCQCEEAPVVPPEVPVVLEPEVKQPPPPKPRAKKKRKPLDGTIKSQPRGDYDGQVRAPPSWVDEFRLQVSARSPRLSQCFKGSERPGALRWTTAVNPKSGAVSDHELEPQGAGPGLQFDQLKCLEHVLENPPYRLSAEQSASLPDRVGMVIEF